MFFKHLNRLQRIDQMIRQQRTGNADSLARKLNVSRRQVYYFLTELKDMGVDIEYCREVNSFVYVKPIRIDINIDIRELTEEEILEAAGGINFIQNNW